MSEPLVSICMITYNHAPFIADAIQGIVSQKTNFPIELVIGEDCSTDNTRKIIEQYQKDYPNIIRLLPNSNNLGVMKNFHRTLNACNGKYIALCEGDDYWTDPLKLQKQVDFLETHPDYSLCFHNAMIHYEDGKTPDCPFGKIEDRDYTGVEIYEKWTIPTASVVLRKNVVKSELYTKVSKEKRFVYGDIVLFLTASKCGKIHGFPEIKSIYRKHSGGVVFQEKLSRKSFQHDIALGELFGQEIKTTTKKVLAKKYFVYCSQQTKKHCYKEAVWAAFKSIKTSPVIFYKLAYRIYFPRLWKH